MRFARVARVPRAGEILHARDSFEEPAGGGAVAAVQLARLAGEAVFFTALGADATASAATTRLEELGVRVRAAPRAGRTRRAVTLVDDARERTITTFGERVQPSAAQDTLPWGELAAMDAVYFTAGDLDALRAARAARILVASARASSVLGHGVPLDALLLSASDETERREAGRARGEARLTVLTEGSRGGAYTTSDGGSGAWEASDPTGPPVDSYGCGDSFHAGLTYGLALGLDVDRALALAARCGALCLTGRGPYERQLTAAEL